MAGTLPRQKNSVSFQESDGEGNFKQPIQRSRKQWNIQEGPRVLLRRMRSQLAEDGDPESQVVMAKALLEEEQPDGSDDCERQAVFWLTRASLQGHERATEMLEKCLREDVGISEHNYHEVRQCLAMDRQEKLARRAAQTLFARLSDGNDSLTSSLLSSHIKQLLGTGREDSKGCDSSLEERYGGERFLEEHLTAAASSYYLGYLPPLQHFLPPLHLLQSPRGLSLLTRDALGTDTLVKYLGVELVKKVRYWYYGATLTKVLLLAVLMALFVNSDSFLPVLPSVLYTVSLLAMAVATSCAVVNYSHLDEFKVWSVLFKSYSEDLLTEKAEAKFVSRWYAPYLSYFASVTLLIALTPFVSTWFVVLLLPPVLIMSVISVTNSIKRSGVTQHMMLFLFLLVSHQNDLILRFAEEYSNYFFNTSVLDFKLSVDLGNHFDLTVTIASLFQVLFMLTNVFTLITKGVMPLLALLTSFCWLFLLSNACAAVATLLDLVLPSLLWFSVIVLLFLPGLFRYILPVCSILSLSQTLHFPLLTSASSAIGFSIIHYLLNRVVKRPMLNHIVLWLSVLTLCYTSLQVDSTTTPSLKWDSYHSVCNPVKETLAKTVSECKNLAGTPIAWQGKVEQVKVLSYVNWVEKAVKMLPRGVQDPLSCALGTRVSECKRTGHSSTEYKRCVLLSQVLGVERCTLDHWGQYTFEVNLSMDSGYWGGAEGPSLSLILSHPFTPLALHLNDGDALVFEGVLLDGLGTDAPRVKASKVNCEMCKYDFTPSHTENLLFVAVKNLFDFFVGPTLTFRKFEE